MPLCLCRANLGAVFAERGSGTRTVRLHWGKTLNNLDSGSVRPPTLLQNKNLIFLPTPPYTERNLWGSTSLWESNSLFFTVLPRVSLQCSESDEEHGAWGRNMDKYRNWPRSEEKWAHITPGSVLELFWEPQHHHNKNDGLIWKIHFLGQNYMNGKVLFPAPFLA